MWLSRLEIWLDLSTFCNAACPQCHRTDINGLGKVDWLPLEQWSLETFKKAFPNPARHRVYTICGTWGDPMMNKDILPILKYIINNSDSTVVIETNGSLRDEQFWWEVGNIGGSRLEVVFCVDGITQEMHSKYRRKTELDKVLKNMLEYSSTDAQTTASTIVFKHNESYLKDIAELVKEYGANKHIIIHSDRFAASPPYNKLEFKFTNEEKVHEILKPSSAQSEPGNRVSETIKL